MSVPPNHQARSPIQGRAAQFEQKVLQRDPESAAQAGAGLEAQNRCAEIKLRAERKAGEGIPDAVSRGGDRKTGSKSHDGTLKTLGINKNQSSRWQQAASVPEAEFEAHITRTKEAQGELTSASVRRLAEGIARQNGRTGIFPAASLF